MNRRNKTGLAAFQFGGLSFLEGFVILGDFIHT
jgi:hypothetical protein